MKRRRKKRVVESLASLAKRRPGLRIDVKGSEGYRLGIASVLGSQKAIRKLNK
jgi:hypothetical protein